MVRASQPFATHTQDKIPVGLLHSLSGTMAISEASLKDATLMAIAEINQADGILGRRIEPVIEDGASDPATFASKARKLIETDAIATIFGCWTSSSRKAVLPVLEQTGTLLWYPVQYEGLENSQNIFYSGSCPNQQVDPAVAWLLQHHGHCFYLLGSDYVFPRLANTIIKTQLKARGGKVVGEDYLPLGATDFKQAIENIQTSGAEVVFNTLNGDSNLSFYQQYKAAGISAEALPIMAVSVAEDELRRIGGEVAAGHYAAWSYFQSLDTPENRTFVRNFQARYGADRVTSDPIEAAYAQVYLWKQAVEAANSFDPDRVRLAARGQTFEAPGGLVRIERNNHLAKPCRIGRILPDGQFEVLFTSDGAIAPQPWLGIEALEFDNSPAVRDMLAEVSWALQSNCQLEQKSRQLEAAMTELKAANQHLREMQQKLLQSDTQVRALAAREELLQRRLSSQIRNSLDLDTILRTALREIRDLLQIDWCRFLWCKEAPEGATSTTFEIGYAVCQPMLVEIPERSSQPFIARLGALVLELELLRADDVSVAAQLDDETRCLLCDVGLTSLLGLLVRTHSGQTGAILCEHSGECHAWSDGEVELLQTVADQLAIAIDQAKLYEQSRVTAAIATAQAEQLKQTLQELQQTQAQLIQTEKMSNLGQLVAGVAHEINNPVSFIDGNLNYANTYANDLLELVQLYQKQDPSPIDEIESHIEAMELDFVLEDFPKVLASMQIGADRIRQIVLSLRNFSRMDATQMQQVDLHEGIDGTLLILQNRLKASSNRPEIRVVKQYGDLPGVTCYGGQLNQVFMNLLSNGIDALESLDHWSTTRMNGSERPLNGLPPNPAANLTTPTLWIRTEVRDRDRVAIGITDNGPGMTDAVQAKLFERFFTTKPIGKGTGLGLSISHQIVVEKHRGSLQCQSTLGEGTTFWIEIPIEPPAQPPLADAQASNSTNSTRLPVQLHPSG